MHVLMISTDRTLLGKVGAGDAMARHREYAKRVKSLDILVLSKTPAEPCRISENCCVYPLYLHNLFSYSRAIYMTSHADLVVCQDPFLTALVGRHLKHHYGAKLLIHFHGDFWENRRWLYEKWYNFIFLVLSKFLATAADAVRVMSKGQAQKLIRAGFEPKKVKVISTPVDLERFANFKNETISAELSAKKNGHSIVLMVGRKDAVKDFTTLFAAAKIVAARLPNFTLWLAGNYNKGQAYDAGLSKSVAVEEFGLIDTLKLPAYYYAADVVTLSSTSESFGKVFIEAGACARPVVATATTGAKEVIEDGKNGFLVPIRDAQALADKIIQLLLDKSLSRTMGEQGRAMAQERFGHNIEKIVNFWEEICHTDGTENILS